MRSISVIGVGRIGGALAVALSRGTEFFVENLIYRDASRRGGIERLVLGQPRSATIADLGRIKSSITIVCTPDPQISIVAQELKQTIGSGSVVLHTSGSLSSDVLSILKKSRCAVGSMHPLVSVSDPLTGAESFGGTYFCIEGDPEAAEAARQIATSLEAIPFKVETSRKALYHAAAVTASGHLVALVDVAIELLSQCKVSEAVPKDVLIPLIQSTVANLAKVSPIDALTGSYARGDAAAVERHLDSFNGTVSDQAARIYVDLAERSLEIAKKGRIDEDAAGLIDERISIAKRKYGC